MKLSCYIAQSLDGYIADSENGLDWLESVAEEGQDYGYNDYYQSVDALVMGRKTYEVVKQFSPWPYQGKTSYVWTREPTSPSANVSFVSGSATELWQNWQTAGHQHIWLVGGGRLLAAFLEAELVDDLIISIVPLSLGQGIALFPPRQSRRQDFKLLQHQAYPSGLVQLHYQRTDNKTEHE